MTTAAPQVVSRPWLSIWTHPRSTFRALLDAPPRPVEWLLIMTSGFAQSLVQGYESSAGAKAPLALIVPMAAVVGSIWGLLQYHLVTGLLFLADRWTGGRVTYREMRTVTAWSAVPQVAIVAAWLLSAAAIGRFLFVNPEQFGPNTTLQPPLIMLALFLVSIVSAIWCVVILVKGVAEAQRSSAGKAILTVLGAGALLLALAFVVVLLVVATIAILR